ncbi:hypothetical protein [Stomatobaculum longum]|nr:hypothetical protein [Stomatobaculum longum]
MKGESHVRKAKVVEMREGKEKAEKKTDVSSREEGDAKGASRANTQNQL